MPRIRGIDLFCGAGGSSHGARAAGVTMVGAIDCWETATTTYKDNFPGAEVVTARLNERSGPSLFSKVQDADLIVASPECTHHSIARGSKPRDERSRRSGWCVMPFVRAYKPRWIVLENVSGMKRWDGYAELIEELEQHYHLRVQLLDASDFGVPQTRKRLFILGDRERRPSKVVGDALRRPTSMILDSATSWKSKPVFGGRLAANTLARIELGIETEGLGKDFLVVYYGSDRAGGWQPLDRPIRTLTTLDRFGLVRWVDGVATFRMLQVPELRRAMGYPDDAKLLRGTRRDKVKLLGNGVCPPVMQAVIESLTSQNEVSAARSPDRASRPPLRQRTPVPA